MSNNGPRPFVTGRVNAKRSSNELAPLRIILTRIECDTVGLSWIVPQKCGETINRTKSGLLSMKKGITGRFHKPRSTTFHRQNESIHWHLPGVRPLHPEKILVPISSGAADRQDSGQDSDKGRLTIIAHNKILLGANFSSIFPEIATCQWFDAKPPQ